MVKKEKIQDLSVNETDEPSEVIVEEDKTLSDSDSEADFDEFGDEDDKELEEPEEEF